MLVTSIFFFSRNVFKRLFPPVCQKSLLCGNGLRVLKIMDCVVNSLPNDKLLGWSKLKAFTDNKIYVAKMVITVFDGVGNIEGKKDNAVHQHFLLFTKCFQRGRLKSGLCCGELSISTHSQNDKF